MRLTNQLRLDAARRVVAFCHRHPDHDPAIAAALGRLQHALQGAREVVESQRRAIEAAAAARVEREAATARVRQLLPYLLRFLAAASTDTRRAMRYECRTLNGIEAAARDALAVAAAHRERLQDMGVPPALLDQLREALARHEAARCARGHGLALRAAATATLDHTATEAMQAIRHLDAIYQIRLAEDPNRLATWNAVRSVGWHRREEPREPFWERDTESVA